MTPFPPTSPSQNQKNGLVTHKQGHKSPILCICLGHVKSRSTTPIKSCTIPIIHMPNSPIGSLAPLPYCLCAKICRQIKFNDDTYKSITDIYMKECKNFQLKKCWIGFISSNSLWECKVLHIRCTSLSRFSPEINVTFWDRFSTGTDIRSCALALGLCSNWLSRFNTMHDVLRINVFQVFSTSSATPLPPL